MEAIIWIIFIGFGVFVGFGFKRITVGFRYHELNAQPIHIKALTWYGWFLTNPDVPEPGEVGSITNPEKRITRKH